MTITTLPKLQDPNECQRASLESGTVRDGEWELFTVGYSLSDLYPQRLDRPILRSTEVQELTRLLTSEKKSPVLLLGPRKVGKTAVIHGAVFNIEHKKSKRHEEYEQVWLLEPQRLISGMSYVGEWERRFQAIVNHAQRYNLTLYFDDLLGLLHAGVSSSSSLSVASLLRPVIEQRRVRVLAEMHPESFRVLRERDRGLADLFHLLPISELSEVDNLHVLIKRQCELEETYQCQMNLDVLPLVIDLQRRFARETAFPGKAASFLQRLTHQSVDKIREQMTRADGPKTVDILGFTLPRPATITRQHVMDRFQEETGLPEAFFDQNQPLSAAAIQQGLSARFVGQRHVLQAGCEIISLAKARLNDPSRPLASLFLLGPTGVGKTEFARSLATYLFGHADRLIRFDMNEYVSPTAVPQLVGTFEQPNGLLTAAIRRQPFAVLLFDEIEKAHPAVYDLLLQILGEGRLTDAFGRTSDFSHAIIVMTSNLGTRRAELGVGFSPSDALTDFAALSAVRSFFRPEFLNRLDRILPFQALSRSDLESIAEHLLRDFCQRDGIARRRCIVQLQPPAVDWILQQGHHPALGARALKRAIERELTQPLARYLAQHPVTSAAHSALAVATAAVTSTAPAETSMAVNDDHALSSSMPQ
ncbi:MAG: AAA family ATPase [Planctomycetota bacterium]